MDIMKIMQKVAENEQWSWGTEYGNESNHGIEVVIVYEAFTKCNIMDHREYPHINAAMKEAGIELVPSDEYDIDHETQKVWRTQPDSHMWRPSVVWSKSEMLTPDHDIEEWLAWVINEPTRCLTPEMVSRDKIEEVGFTLESERHEAGWHQGMDADPTKMLESMRETMPDSEVVFYLAENSQFYVTFDVYTRPTMATVSSNAFSHDTQVMDAVRWLRVNRPDQFEIVRKNYPEIDRVTIDGAWVAFDRMKIHPEWSSWLADWIEQETCIEWREGEPYAILR